MAWYSCMDTNTRSGRPHFCVESPVIQEKAATYSAAFHPSCGWLHRVNVPSRYGKVLSAHDINSLWTITIWNYSATQCRGTVWMVLLYCPNTRCRSKLGRRLANGSYSNQSSAYQSRTGPKQALRRVGLRSWCGRSLRCCFGCDQCRTHRSGTI